MATTLNLTQFPIGFTPLTIVTGDRRDRPPKTKGDLLAYSVSTIDFMHLQRLGLHDVDIITDKTVVLEDENTLRYLFGRRHILSIGSPAVNLFSRMINRQSIFKFNIPNEAWEDAARHESVIESIKFSSFELMLYQRFFETGMGPDQLRKLEEFGDRQAEVRDLYARFQGLRLNYPKWKNFVHSFDLPGIIDPMDEALHGTSVGRDNDFGLISFAPNPFAEQGEPFFAIWVAGIHGIATAIGLKQLGNACQVFEKRPIGGVFEVQFPPYGGWHRKLQEAVFKWQTRPYLEEKARERAPGLYRTFRPTELGFFISAPYDETDPRFRKLTEEIKTVAETHFSTGVTETAYSIKTAGRGGFPEVICDQIRHSMAMIHLLNGYKPGVLFEVGLSIGYGRPFFLVWDREESFDAGELPECLRQINVIQLDKADPADLKQKILVDLIKPAIEYSRTPPGPAVVRNPISSRVLLHVSRSFAEHESKLQELLRRFEYRPIDPAEEPIGPTRQSRLLDRVAMAEKCVLMLDSRDRDGIVMLGVAQALMRETLLLAENWVSMFPGEHCAIPPSGLNSEVETHVQNQLRRWRRSG